MFLQFYNQFNYELYFMLKKVLNDMKKKVNII